MAEEKTLPLPEKDDASRLKDGYIPEEPTADVSISLLDIQMPETPESTKGQISDGDTSRLESPKMVKPVLGKVQAKKRLMAFANKFNVLPKPQVKANLSQHSTALKTKDKVAQEDTNINKSRKKPEEKILAIEEIRREESKSKMLLAEAMAAASMEDENHTEKNTSGGLSEGLRHTREKNRLKKLSNSSKDTTKSTMDRKCPDRHRQRDKTDRDSLSREAKDRNGSGDRLSRKSSQDKEKHKKDRKKKDDRDKRDSRKADGNRDKREEGKDKRESEKEKREEKKEERKERRKSKKESTREKRSEVSEMEAENKDKKEKSKNNKGKEKELLRCNSWAEIRKSGLNFIDIIHHKKRDNTERSPRNKTGQDYARHFEQMLMLNNHRPKRHSLVAEGIDGPKKYPPESIKMTKRTRGTQLLYCENPRTSLLLSVSQLLQAVTPDRREKIREICEATSSQADTEDPDVAIDKRTWYQQVDKGIKYHKDSKWQVRLPRSKWDSEDEETSSTIVAKEEIEKPINKLHVSLCQQERCSTSSSIGTDEDKVVDNNGESNKRDNESSEKTIDNTTTNDETSASPLQLESAGNEKLASEYEQFMKMVCTDIPVPATSMNEVPKEYSPKKNPRRSVSPRSYHEFNIESNLEDDSTSVEMPSKENFEEKDKQQMCEESVKSTEPEESILSADCQIQTAENSVRDERRPDNEIDDSKSIPSDWENVRIKVERLSDENTDSREVKKRKRKKRKKQKKVTSSSDSASSSSSSESGKEKKKKKHKRKAPNNSSSSDSESTDSSSSSSSSSSSDSSSSDEKRKKKRKKKVGKRRKKARRAARTKKKRRRKASSDSSSSDSDERVKKKKKKNRKAKEAKQFDAKSINNGDINKVMSKSPSVSPSKKVKEEATTEEDTRVEQVTPARKNTNARDDESAKLRRDKKEGKSDESFIEEWDCMITTQETEDDTSSQDRIEGLEKMDGSEKDKHRRKRKLSRENIEQDKDRSSKGGESEKGRSDEELEVKRKRKREKDIRNSTEFLADWEREGERISQQMIQNETKFSKKSEKQRKDKWGETDFDTLNVPSLTQLEKEVCRKELLADEWEVDSLEAIPDLVASKRRSASKKTEKEVRYDKRTDTYIAIEKETAREMKRRQGRFCAIRIWEEEQEEGEREEMMLLEQKSKRKRDDWDIEEESFLHKSSEEVELPKADEIVKVEKEWSKLDEDPRKDVNKSTAKPAASKRVRKSRWDMGSQSDEKLAAKDIWEEEYADWSKLNKCQPGIEKTEKETPRGTDHPETSSTSDLVDFYHRKPQNSESLERSSWTPEETSSGSVVQTKKAEEIATAQNLITVGASEEQTASTKKEHQTKDQFKESSMKEILELGAKLNEKTIELYSPSSPALSQKSQDASNDSSCSSSSLRKKPKKELLIAEELSIPTTGIPLQLTMLRDAKQLQVANEKIEDAMDAQSECKVSPHKFDIKKVDDLFDSLPMNEPCPTAVHGSKATRMDIFAEYESEGSRDKQQQQQQQQQQRVSSSTAHVKDDETNFEEKTAALKLIPKQLLIRRPSEPVKQKPVLETPLQDPAQHAAALLTIQKKLLESHALKSDSKESPKYSAASSSETLVGNKLLDRNEFDVAPKSSVIAETRCSRSPVPEKPIAGGRSGAQLESYDRDSKNADAKKSKNSRKPTDAGGAQSRSPAREQRKRSPVVSRKESEKRYSHDHNKDKKERKSDEADKSDRRGDSRGSKAESADGRRRSSPSRSKRKRSSSPYTTSWERQGSGSGSPRHSWSRSRSKSPKRKDEGSASARDREKKRNRYEDERPGRSRTDDRRERYARSPRSGYDEDNFKKHGSKSNRDDWGRRRHDSVDRDREKDVRSYDPMEMLRERTAESEKYRERDSRFRAEGEADRTFWQYETSNLSRDGNESMDSYAIAQDISAMPSEFDDRPYYREGSLERDMRQSSPQRYRRSQNRSGSRRERQWERDNKDASDLDRHGHLAHLRLDKPRSRTPPRSRLSPVRQPVERLFRRQSRSRSKTWSRSRSRSRSRSKSRSRSRSPSRSRLRRMRSKSRSRSRSNSRSRAGSSSVSKLRSPELRMSELRSSRSPSPGRDRFSEVARDRKDEDENRKLSVCGERGRRIETIVQSGAGLVDSEMGINSSLDGSVASFQYPGEIEGRNDYYYTENNLTYPPCMDESTTSSPKRLSLDDRLELELGIKKQQNKDSMSSEYSSSFNSNVITYPSPPQQQQQQQQQQQMMYRQQPTVLQVGNVLQVVPADFNGVQSVRREVSTSGSVDRPSTVRGSSQVVRVGNVLQVVPTSLDWSSSGGVAGGVAGGVGVGVGGSSGSGGSSSGGAGSVQSSSTDQPGSVLYSSVVPAPSPATATSSSIPMAIPVPVPVPLPVPPATGVPATTMPPSAASLPLSLPVPVPVPVPIPTTATFPPRNEVQPQKIAQPVYNYEAILETRRKEREERKQVRELRRKEKERRRIERTNRRALKLLEKNSMLARQAAGVPLDRRKGSIVDPSVLKALREGEEQNETQSPSANVGKDEEEAVATSVPIATEEDEDAAADEDEDEDEDEAEAEAEAEVEDDEEEEEEAEDEDEDDEEDDEKTTQVVNQRAEPDEMAMSVDASKSQVEVEIKQSFELPPPPLKGILVTSGFRDTVSNGNVDDLSDVDGDTEDGSDKDEETDKNTEHDKDGNADEKTSKPRSKSKLKSAKPLKKRSKKSVQFADGIKPGEGTSPSGGEGDMPSPPPPTAVGFRDELKELRREKLYSSRKSRKQEKRARPPKTKKKVKVKIIKLKKPRITPLTAMMMDDSDELDDRSPPPPPPGSPPPPHLWPSYLSAYNTTIRAAEPTPQTTTPALTSVQAPPPPTPLPLLVPPPPLNYTIQPCSKA